MKFNAKKETEKIIKFIRDYYERNNLKGVVLGISGGKDSAVVAALFSKAIGPENVLGVTLPCHSEKTDTTDAIKVAEKYGFELINLDLTNVFDAYQEEVYKLGNFTEQQLKNSTINLKPRLRMSSVYYLAALYSELKGGTYIVAGTSNKSELFVGYFTKGGDSTHDIAVINDFTVEEVIKIGEYLEVPDEVIHKVPSDGLSNQTDEDKLGVKYKDIAKYINNEELDIETKNKIEKLHKNANHKFNIPKYKRTERQIYKGTLKETIKYINENIDYFCKIEEIGKARAFDKIKEELLEKQFSKEIKESTMINIKVATDLYNIYYYEIEK